MKKRLYRDKLPVTEETKKRILGLLRDSDLTMQQIAYRMRCDQSEVGRINIENGEIRRTRPDSSQGKSVKPRRVAKANNQGLKGGFLL